MKIHTLCQTLFLHKFISGSVSGGILGSWRLLFWNFHLSVLKARKLLCSLLGYIWWSLCVLNGDDRVTRWMICWRHTSVWCWPQWTNREQWLYDDTDEWHFNSAFFCA